MLNTNHNFHRFLSVNWQSLHQALNRQADITLLVAATYTQVLAHIQELDLVTLEHLEETPSKLVPWVQRRARVGAPYTDSKLQLTTRVSVSDSLSPLAHLELTLILSNGATPLATVVVGGSSEFNAKGVSDWDTVLQGPAAELLALHNTLGPTALAQLEQAIGRACPSMA